METPRSSSSAATLPVPPLPSLRMSETEVEERQQMVNLVGLLSTVVTNLKPQQTEHEVNVHKWFEYMALNILRQVQEDKWDRFRKETRAFIENLVEEMNTKEPKDKAANYQKVEEMNTKEPKDKAANYKKSNKLKRKADREEPKSNKKTHVDTNVVKKSAAQSVIVIPETENEPQSVIVIPETENQESEILESQNQDNEFAESVAISSNTLQEQIFQDSFEECEEKNKEDNNNSTDVADSESEKNEALDLSCESLVSHVSSHLLFKK